MFDVIRSHLEVAVNTNDFGHLLIALSRLVDDTESLQEQVLRLQAQVLRLQAQVDRLEIAVDRIEEAI